MTAIAPSPDQTKPPRIKRPVGQPGHRKPYKKPTNIEVEQRIEAAYLLLAQRRVITQIHAIFAKEYGLDWHTTNRYLSRARDRMLKESGSTKAEQRQNSFHTYLSVIRDPRSKSSDKIQAQRSIDDLLALPEPKTVRNEVSGPDGAPISIASAPVVIVWPHETMSRENQIHDVTTA